MIESPKAPSDIKDAVVKAIRDRGLAMKPRWHFVLRAALLAIGTMLAALTLLFVVSFIVFSARLNGAWFGPAFGLRGLRALLGSLPWLLVALAVAFIVILEVLVARYAFAYRRPLFYSALGIAMIAAIGGMAVAATPFHGGVFARVRDHRLPFAEPLYREYGLRDPRGIFPGTVVGLTADGFLLQERLGESLDVRVTPDTRFPYGTRLAPNDAVVVFGDREGDRVRAFGVRRVEGGETEFWRNRPAPPVDFSR